MYINRTFTALIGLAILSFVACGTDVPEAVSRVDEAPVDEPEPGDAAVYADQVYTNARVYTVDEANPWAEAVAVRDGIIMAVGSNAEIGALSGEGTESIDLEGRMLMPGIHDMHNHATDAGIREKFECSFPLTTMEEALAVVAECAANTPPGEWISGGQWADVLFTTDRSPKDILDEVSADHPIFLMDSTVHNAWVNSAALERFGIDADTPDPDGGVIKRDLTSGVATGILYDNAAYYYRKQLPVYTREQLVEALTWSLGELIQFGITSFKEAIVTEATLKAYRAIDQARGLPARVKASLTWKSEWADSHQQEIDLIATRHEYSSEMLNTDFAKIMLDGIPHTYTAALLEPYMPSEEHGDDYRGQMMLDYDELIEDVVELDRLGMTVKIHATGDRSVRSALDAFQAAREANGDSGLVHEVSHAEMIHVDDLPRFSELNVAAEMCPIMWYPLPGLDMTVMVGEERTRQWAIRSLVDSGAWRYMGRTGRRLSRMRIPGRE